MILHSVELEADGFGDLFDIDAFSCHLVHDDSAGHELVSKEAGTAQYCSDLTHREFERLSDLFVGATTAEHLSDGRHGFVRESSGHD